ncbi:hypothetical protein BJ878DRAFT_189630 [Calycina marina]|uniref:3'-5' exonuclease domain-containing protein n=1 Tax=Calycina marina TaxID=1763456 RepID=A0A9P8CCL6_9HELO|nr:hypothetical protein BJ878DRAFT_189630 [Calycina marina]
MISRNHGVSTLYGVLSQSFYTHITEMISFYGVSGLAVDATRSTMAYIRGRDVASAAPRVTYMPVSLQQTWRPSHGVVFSSSSAGTSRPLSIMTSFDAEQSSPIEMTKKQLEDLTLGNTSATPSPNPPLISEPLISKQWHAATAIVYSELQVGNAEESIEEPTSERPEQSQTPTSTTSFKMSEELFQAAKNAEPESAESYWLHTLYRGPDGPDHKVKVHYCKSLGTTEKVLQEFFIGQKLLGFDLEWKPEARSGSGIKKCVSLIQLASEERIALFHVALFPGDKLEDLMPPTLKKIMEDPQVTKVGVAIKGDCTRLKNNLIIESRGLFELSHLYKLVKYSASSEPKLINKKLISLAQQTRELLHLPLFKGGDVRGSDWSQSLVMDQIVYAAADAYAGIHIFDALEQKRQQLDPMPPRPHHAELDLPIRTARGVDIDGDEDAEAEEPESPKTTRRQSRKTDAAFLATASEGPEVELDGLSLDASSDVNRKLPKVAKTTKLAVSRTAQDDLFQSPLVVAAAAEAKNYQAINHQNRASPPSLRCYFIWQQSPLLSVNEIAALLRDPPLASSTVATYIADAVSREKFSFDKERMRSVLEVMHSRAVSMRYSALARDCDMPVER